MYMLVNTCSDSRVSNFIFFDSKVLWNQDDPILIRMYESAVNPRENALQHRKTIYLYACI